MIGYYDSILGLIPVTLFGLTGLLVGGGFPTTTAVALSGVPTVALIGHALFVNGPTPVSSPTPSDGDRPVPNASPQSGSVTAD